MKRSAFLLLLLLICPLTRAEKVATLSAPTGYVDDFASVLSSSARTDLEALCKEIHDKTKAQIFLVTIKTTEGEEASTFTNQLFAKWKIGEKKTDRGVLLLLSIDDHHRWIEVGYGLEGILNDAKVGDISRAMVPDLRAARYDEAAHTGILDIAQIIAQDSGVTLETSKDSTQSLEATTQPQPQDATDHKASPWLIALLILLFGGPVILFIILFVLARRRNAAFGSGLGGVNDSGSSFSSFGGSSSDSFTSSDSSSDSFSGGDGGSSGGGGAGGDW